MNIYTLSQSARKLILFWLTTKNILSYLLITYSFDTDATQQQIFDDSTTSTPYHQVVS